MKKKKKKKETNKNPTTKQNPLVNKILKKKDVSLDLRDGEGSGCSFDSRFWLERKKCVLEQDLVLDYIISSARGLFNLRIWHCPVVNFELAGPPTSFSCPARLPGPLSPGRGF